MKTILCLAIIVVVGMTLCQAASTTRRPHHTHQPGQSTHMHRTHPTGLHSHPTREPSEHENFSFYYQSKSHKFFIHVGTKCYIAALTDDEKLSVHTDAGIRALELKVLQTLGSATQVTPDMVSTDDAHTCGKKATSWYTLP